MYNFSHKNYVSLGLRKVHIYRRNTILGLIIFLNKQLNRERQQSINVYKSTAFFKPGPLSIGLVVLDERNKFKKKYSWNLNYKNNNIIKYELLCMDIFHENLSLMIICSVPGIGIATFLMCFLSITYYIVILAWGLYYMYASVAMEIPWGSCFNTWNTDRYS